MFLEISTTVGCGMSCSYCPQATIAKAYSGPRLMSFEIFAAALANCPAGITVSFAGYAEPYLNRECSAMIAHAAAGGHPVLVYTTGVGMNDADVELLIRIQPQILMLHLPDNDNDMKVGGAVNAEYLLRMRRLSQHVESFQAVCYGNMHHLLIEFSRYLKGYGLHSRAGNVVQLAQVPKMSGPLKCRVAPGLDENVLLPDGRLALCCQDWNLRHMIGDLTKQTRNEIHGGSAMAEVKRLMHDGGALCQTCEFAECA